MLSLASNYGLIIARDFCVSKKQWWPTKTSAGNRDISGFGLTVRNIGYTLSG